MRKNLFVSMFVLLSAVMLLSACGPSTAPTATEAPGVATDTADHRPN